MEVSDGGLPLDLSCILLSTVIKPTSEQFCAGPCEVADHQGFVLSVSVSNGKGTLEAGAPVIKPPSEFDQIVSTDSDSCDSELKAIASSVKSGMEELFDISFSNFILQFGIRENQPPFLVSCNGSEYLVCQQMEPFADSLVQIALLFATEVSIKVSSSVCLTRGKYCLAGSQSIERSKIVVCHIRSMIEKLAMPESAFTYIKRKLTNLCPSMMMTNVPVCTACFKYYTADLDEQKRCSTATGRTRQTVRLTDLRQSYGGSRAGNRTQTQRILTRSSVSRGGQRIPILRPDMIPFRRGELTQSGLKVSTDRSTQNYERACRLYARVPFERPPPPLPDPNFRYKPKSTDIK